MAVPLKQPLAVVPLDVTAPGRIDVMHNVFSAHASDAGGGVHGAFHPHCWEVSWDVDRVAGRQDNLLDVYAMLIVYVRIPKERNLHRASLPL
jgi:hypothetical protein